jgi:uncharacterized protein (DUF2235 family)
MAGRNLVVFSDGTGNSSAKLFKTNVWRIYEALDVEDGTQLALYDDGVGTASFGPLAALGGAFGFGLKRNVHDLYVFLARNYQPGDRIFAFGFSRGAFTVRVLIGLIAEEGLVHGAHRSQKELKRLAHSAFRHYRRHYNPTGGLVQPLRWLGDTIFRLRDALRGAGSYAKAPKQKVDVAFLGVWDTVDAYGLPMDELTHGWDQWVWPLSFPHINRVPANVQKACHAVAVDDERHTFHPLLWDERDESADRTHIKDERVTQVWFAGMHSDVGGSYPDDGMAHTPLVWMAGEAHRAGLRFQPELRGNLVPELWPPRRSRSAPIHDSRQGLGGYYRYNPRHMKRLCLDADADVRVDRPKIHASVFTRLSSGPDDYAPIILPDRYAVVDDGGAIVDGTRFEHPTQAASRCHLQERVWNLVWQRRVVYFATVLASLVLLAAPFLRPNFWGLNASVPTLSGVIGLLSWVLPDAASTWVAHFQAYPAQLLLGGVIIGLLMARSTALQRRIGTDMRAIWLPTIQAPATPVADAGLPSDAVFKLRTHPAYVGFFRVLTRYVLPTFFGVLMLATIVLGGAIALYRIGFEALAVSGQICRETGAPIMDTGSFEASLAPNELCDAAGVRLKAGVRYRIAVDAPVGWFDESIPVPTADGFASGDYPKMYVFTPLRRIVTANWLAPVARIGSRGADFVVLGSQPVVVTPRRDAELFLFANDALAPLDREFFYRNNRGQPVRVTITVTPE